MDKPKQDQAEKELVAFPSAIERVIQALESTHPADLILPKCPRCNETTPTFAKASLFDCSCCDNRSIDVLLGG